MPKYILFFLALWSISGCQNSEHSLAEESDTLQLTAHITGTDDSILLVILRSKGEYLQDTVNIQDGNIEYESALDEPAYVQIRSFSGQQLIVFVEPGDIEVTADMTDPENVEVTGSQIHDQSVKFNKEMKPYDNDMDSLMTEYREFMENGTWEANQEAFMNRYEISDSLRLQGVKNYISDHGDENYSSYIVYRNFMMDSDADELQALYDNLSDDVQDTYWSKEVKDMIGIKKKTAVGQPFLDFAQADATGNELRLSELKGQLTLVDFWASWCGPCRQENPNVVDVYKKYHDQGFEILGVSLDTDRARWLQAIDDDQLDWYQVSDLKGWKNEVAELYGIRAIPTNILVDKNGIIVKKNLRGEELRKTIPEYL